MVLVHSFFCASTQALPHKSPKSIPLFYPPHKPCDLKKVYQMFKFHYICRTINVANALAV